MEQDKRSFIHDTINLDEIRKLLGEDVGMESAADSSADLDTPSEENRKAASIQDDDVDFHSFMQARFAEIEKEEQEKPEFLPQEQEPVSDVEMMEKDEEDSSEVSEAEVLVEEENAERLDDVETSLQQDIPEKTSVETNAASEHIETTESEAVEEKKKTSFVYELYCMLHDVIYLLAAVTLVFVFIIRLVGVKGDSMLPTLHNQDYLLLESNFLYSGDDLKYGDIVVLSVPYYEENGEGPIVKRVIATEGQTVNIDFDTGAVYVDGVMLSETYINTPTNYNWGEYGLEYPAVVPENCIFVLGDNRNNSMDSRYAPIGMIDERCVLGKVLVIALPGQTVDQSGNVLDPRDWSRIGLVS